MVSLYITQDITCVVEYKDEILVKTILYMVDLYLDTQHVWASSCTFYNYFRS